MDIKTVNEIIRETDVMTVSYNINVTEEEFSRMADNPEAYRQNIISSTEQWLRDIEHNTGITPESITVETTSDIRKGFKVLYYTPDQRHFQALFTYRKI